MGGQAHHGAAMTNGRGQAYATVADFEDRFGEDEAMRLGDAKRLAVALGDAAAEIDAHLATAFTVPLTGGPFPMITSIACDLARIRLYDEAATDTVRDTAKRARLLLDRLVSGEADLLDADGMPLAPRDGGSQSGAAATGPKPVFGRDAFEGF